uniref:Uncharacterized protein n=1 Tax=Sinocyclocheilus grahami TaxID=75366 RepID=A0A672NDM3_SINGR
CMARVFKVVFLGNSAVGKSSFIHHYCSGHFPNNLASTVGERLALQLWDTAGQERSDVPKTVS